MITPLFILSVLCIPEAASAKEAVGWHWYNEIYPEIKTYEKNEKDENKERGEKDKKHEKYGKNKKEDSAMNQIVFLRQVVQEAKAKAILYPSEENMRSYLILQNFVMNQANRFAHVWKKTQLDYPELDYSVLHPVQNSAQHVLYLSVHNRENEAIKTFSKKYGLLFFYRGNNPLDQELAPTIESFSRENNISLIPVSIDGKKLEVFGSFEMNQIDSGQAERLGIKYFPALILVDPKNQKVRPLNYGFISDSDLRRRFLQVATDFKEGV
jgi:conjugal transfer pilus assembly protein TraF